MTIKITPAYSVTSGDAKKDLGFGPNIVGGNNNSLPDVRKGLGIGSNKFMLDDPTDVSTRTLAGKKTSNSFGRIIGDIYTEKGEFDDELDEDMLSDEIESSIPTNNVIIPSDYFTHTDPISFGNSVGYRLNASFNRTLDYEFDILKEYITESLGLSGKNIVRGTLGDMYPKKNVVGTGITRSNNNFVAGHTSSKFSRKAGKYTKNTDNEDSDRLGGLGDDKEIYNDSLSFRGVSDDGIFHSNTKFFEKEKNNNDIFNFKEDFFFIGDEKSDIRNDNNNLKNHNRRIIKNNKIK